MKKLGFLLACALLVMGLAACGGASTAATPTPDAGPAADGIILRGQSLALGMNMTESILSSMGTAEDIQKAPSCHFDGEDTLYLYNGCTLYTYADGDKNILYLIELNDAGAETPAGAEVGMPLEDAISLYGKDYEEMGSAILYALSDDTFLRISHDGQTVTMIEFEEAPAED